MGGLVGTISKMSGGNVEVGGGKEVGNEDTEVNAGIEEFCKRFIEVENLFYEFMGLPKDEVMLEEYNGGRHMPPFDEDIGFGDEVDLREDFIKLRKVRDILVALTASEGWHVKGMSIDNGYMKDLQKLFDTFCKNLNKKLSGKTVEEVRLTNYKFGDGSKLDGCRFKNSTMNGCKFCGIMNMPRLSFEGSTFSGNLCDTIEIRDADSVQFIRSRVSRLTIQKGSSEPDSGIMRSFSASDCTIQESTWNALKMERSKIRNSWIIRCKFLAIDFSQTMFDKSRLVESIFDDCNLSTSRFYDCSLIDCELVLTSQCDMRDCELNGVSLNTSQAGGGVSGISGCKITGDKASAHLDFGEVVATWQGNWITYVPISGKLKKSSISDCKFSDVTFTGGGSKAEDTFFDNTTFINCVFEACYSQTTFINCTFIGACPNNPEKLDRVSFIGCRFSSKDAIINDAKIIDCTNVGRPNIDEAQCSDVSAKATYVRCTFG